MRCRSWGDLNYSSARVLAHGHRRFLVPYRILVLLAHLVGGPGEVASTSRHINATAKTQSCSNSSSNLPSLSHTPYRASLYHIDVVQISPFLAPRRPGPQYCTVGQDGENAPLLEDS